MRKLRGIVCLLVIIMTVSIIAAGANAQHNLQFYFSPQVMDDVTGEIIVDLRMRNFALSVPKNLGVICGLTMAFEYDRERFDIVCNENGTPIFSVDEDTLIKKASDIEIKYDGRKITFVFLDSTLKENLIGRDGVLCRFTLVSKNAKALWNSADYYPIRFEEGSVGVITYDLEDLDVGRFEGAEGVDGKVGGYNLVPDFVIPAVDKKITFTDGSSNIIVNDETKTIDAAPYKEDGEWMIPVRFLSENIGMSVEWNDGTMTASSYGEYKTLKISIKDNNPIVFINAAKVALQTQPNEIGGRIYIPLEVVTRLYPDTEISAGETELTISFK